MPSAAPSRSARGANVALAVAVLLGFAVAAGVIVRRRRRAWDDRAARICACSVDVVSRLQRGAAASPDDLAAVMRAQGRLLEATCGDLRAALRARTATEAFRERPLRVPPTAEHDAATRDLRASLRRLCDPERDAVWSRDPAATLGGSPWSADLIRAANEARRLRGALCARRALLAGDPEPYTLTAAQADEEARTCGRPGR